MTDPAVTTAVTTTTAVTDEEVAAYVTKYLTERGLPADDVAAGSGLDELGLDSLSVAELLLTAREDLTASGRLPTETTLDELPPLGDVHDLADLLRSLAA